MKDKELRNLLDKEGFICTYSPYAKIGSKGMWSIGSKLQRIEDKLQDQQEQIDFILKHLNIDIEKFKGYVKK
jgi:hypothetical protein